MYIYIHMYIIKRTVHTNVRIYGYITFMILLSKQQKSRVQATQMRVLRRIEGVSRVDRVRNVDIRLRLGQEGILDVVRRRQEQRRTD